MHPILKTMRFTLLSLFCLTVHLSNLHAENHAKNSAVLTSPDGIAFMTGGVGHEDVLTMRQHAKNFSLNLLFSEGAAGQALTDVNVNIYDENSTLVFRLKGSKPLLYVNLPTGTYTILANNNGAKLRHKINITEDSHQKVILNWKNEALDSRESSNESN